MTTARGVAGGIQPRQEQQPPPCGMNCASGADIRGWIGVVAQRRKLGISDREALARAWAMLSAVNPFPATLGRVCPHPCEANCNRKDKDGAVAVHALERFLGDWALAQRLALPRLDAPGACPESIGVIGAGPAGLSFAYQLARRGYRVTLYEKAERPGGMLYFGIPQYRLPDRVLAAEVQRIVDLGVDLWLNTMAGRDAPVPTVAARHDVLFLGIGAGGGIRLGIVGEDGPGVWTGTEYLASVNRGAPPQLGERVIVVGGGNTAVDAARAARRAGASVTLLYRRTRAEMPAIDAEVDDAVAEGVDIEYLAAPTAVRRENGVVRAVVVQRMRLGEPDGSGRRAPVAVEGATCDLPADTVIAAVSQQPDWAGLAELRSGTLWAQVTGDGEVRDRLWAGGDVRGLGLAGIAVAQGRRAAEAVHARLRGLAAPGDTASPPVSSPRVKPDFYTPVKPLGPPRRPSDEWLSRPDDEIEETISEAQFLEEVARCFSCGLCFGCEQCFTYCNEGGFSRLQDVNPGRYYALNLELCESCGKCVDLCPCGFLERA